jgi:hypothetical protein
MPVLRLPHLDGDFPVSAHDGVHHAVGIERRGPVYLPVERDADLQQLLRRLQEPVEGTQYYLPLGG